MNWGGKRTLCALLGACACATGRTQDEAQLRVIGSEGVYGSTLRLITTPGATPGLDSTDRLWQPNSTNTSQRLEIKSYIFDSGGEEDIALEVDARPAEITTIFDAIDVVVRAQNGLGASGSNYLQFMFPTGPLGTFVARATLYGPDTLFVSESVINPLALQADVFGRILYPLPSFVGYPDGVTSCTLTVRRDMLTTNDCVITNFSVDGTNASMSATGPIGAFATPVLYQATNSPGQKLTNSTASLPATIGNFDQGISTVSWTNLPAPGVSGFYRVSYSPIK